MSKPVTSAENDLHSATCLPKSFRRFGHAIVGWIANYFERIEQFPVLAQIEPGDLKAQLPSTPPAQGEPMEAILGDVDRLIVPALTPLEPSFLFRLLCHFNFSSRNFRRAFERRLRVKSMLWRTSPASTELEEVVLDWLRQMLGLDAGMTGFIYDTASVSSMHCDSAPRARAWRCAFAKKA
jgi:aromatic-L-amino-acid decarboxylase